MHSSSLTLKYEVANTIKYANKHTNRFAQHFYRLLILHEESRQSLIHEW